MSTDADTYVVDDWNDRETVLVFSDVLEEAGRAGQAGLLRTGRVVFNVLPVAEAITLDDGARDAVKAEGVEWVVWAEFDGEPGEGAGFKDRSEVMKYVHWRLKTTYEAILRAIEGVLQYEANREIRHIPGWPGGTFMGDVRSKADYLLHPDQLEQLRERNS